MSEVVEGLEEVRLKDLGIDSLAVGVLAEFLGRRFGATKCTSEFCYATPRP